MKEPLLSVKRLNWDSNFFKIEVGQIHLKNQKISSIDEKDFDLIYIHSNTLIEDKESICYDKKITFSKVVSAHQKKITHSLIKKHTGLLKNSLLKLALDSGEYSRFKTDPKLSPYFIRLYTLWIQNSLNGSIADHVFIYEKDNEILGFVTLRKKDGFHQIGLIATSSSHRGLGIGSLLLQKVDNVVLSEGGSEVRVVTQLDNQLACNFYKKNDYKEYNKEYIYHLWSKTILSSPSL
ncbi:GNAT family N-acetyltransferase [uncultured Aquimarina sp.]|uniref:GNAT family N-acetyltransferase n=1 Tax=uncultured Aquimarina sp. TaxID=575652 RepID=UPI00260CD345|nr:GNAT family N-acetyltransferase [uncultured Aquimarina sp.]